MNKVGDLGIPVSLKSCELSEWLNTLILGVLPLPVSSSLGVVATGDPHCTPLGEHGWLLARPILLSPSDASGSKTDNRDARGGHLNATPSSPAPPEDDRNAAGDNMGEEGCERAEILG